MYKVIFTDNQPTQNWKAIDHLDGGWIRCYNPNSDHRESERHPPTRVKKIVEKPYQ